jgi:hypothetical protein
MKARKGLFWRRRKTEAEAIVCAKLLGQAGYLSK